MAQHEPVDPLLEFDTLLKQELSVTPSPEFLPRVRERIHFEPEPSRWPRLWILVPMAAAATLVLSAGLTYWITPTSPVAPTAPVFTVAAIAPHAVIPDRTPSTTPTFALRATVGKPNTEIIVDQHQRVALASLLRLINQGQLTEESFKNTTPLPLDIGVDPVAVSPIVVGGVLPSEGERK